MDKSYKIFLASIRVSVSLVIQDIDTKKYVRLQENLTNRIKPIMNFR